MKKIIGETGANFLVYGVFYVIICDKLGEWLKWSPRGQNRGHKSVLGESLDSHQYRSGCINVILECSRTFALHRLVKKFQRAIRYCTLPDASVASRWRGGASRICSNHRRTPLFVYDVTSAQ